MADTSQKSSAPTKADLWGEVKEARAQREELLKQTLEVIQENTRVNVGLSGAVESLHKLVEAQQGQQSMLMSQLAQALCNQANGVPIKVFWTVVVLLCLVIAAVVGLDVSGLAF